VGRHCGRSKARAIATALLIAATACTNGDIGETLRPSATIDSPSRDTTIILGSVVTFRGTAIAHDGEIENHLWDCGDGNGATTEDPGEHEYGSAGTFIVAYQLLDAGGSVSAADSVVVVRARTATPLLY